MGLSSLLHLRSSHSKSPNDGNSDSPPTYKEAVGSHGPDSSSFSNGFVVTGQLQIHAIGYDANQALTGRTLENISVYRVESGQAEYTSIRRKKNSNSCALVPASDPSQTALISTIYRLGPGRHPRMHILPVDSSVSVDEALENDNVPGEQVEVKSRSWYSRGQIFDTSFGKFEWRYGSGEERDCYNADSLLVMERIDHVSLPDGEKNTSGARIAQLIRNDEFRTTNTKRDSGGNGGRLMMDLRMWNDEKHSSASAMEAFVVASCILMLKREADRFIDNHIAAVV